jgi:hypothetical protein
MAECAGQFFFCLLFPCRNAKLTEPVSHPLLALLFVGSWLSQGACSCHSLAIAARINAAVEFLLSGKQDLLLQVNCLGKKVANE